MKKIMFLIFLFLSLMVCITSLGWAGGLEDANAGIEAVNGGDYDKALGLFTKAIESGELSQKNLSIVYNNRGVAWRKKGDNDKAIADYTKAIEINPQYVSAYNNRGVAWNDKGDNDKAIADYTKAIEINPKHANAWYNCACSYSLKGEKDKALSDLKRAITFNESSKDYAKEDKDFKDLWDDEDFKKLTE